MRRSKLEMYVDILKVLAHTGPQKLTNIMYKANVNGNLLKESLGFLIAQGLIEEQTVGERSVVYINTPKATAVLKYFGESSPTVPMVEEKDDHLPFSY